MISIFSPTALDRIVSETLVDVPVTHHNALVGAVDQHGAQIEARFALGADQNWIFKGAYRHDWTGENTVGGKVIISW